MEEIKNEIIIIFRENKLTDEEKKLFLMTKFSESLKNEDFESAKVCKEMIKTLNKNTSI